MGNLAASRLLYGPVARAAEQREDTRLNSKANNKKEALEWETQKLEPPENSLALTE